MATSFSPEAALIQHSNDVYSLAACTVRVVSTASDLENALLLFQNRLSALPVVAMDLEWTPGPKKAQSKTVSLLQLSSGNDCLLIRTCHVPFKGPLSSFLGNPGLRIVSFGWRGADEQRMQQCFNWRRTDFGSFDDLQLISSDLGYMDMGLAKLASLVLGVPVPKDRKVATSNWNAGRLSLEQVKYAAVDVLATYHTYCQLVSWQQCHLQAPSCQDCSRQLGMRLQFRWQCLSCTMCFLHRGALQGHGQKANHDTGLRVCSGCGRVSMEQPPPPSTAQQGWGWHMSHSERLRVEEEEKQAGVQFSAQ